MERATLTAGSHEAFGDRESIFEDFGLHGVKIDVEGTDPAGINDAMIYDALGVDPEAAAKLVMTTRLARSYDGKDNFAVVVRISSEGDDATIHTRQVDNEAYFKKWEERNISPEAIAAIIRAADQQSIEQAHSDEAVA